MNIIFSLGARGLANELVEYASSRVAVLERALLKPDARHYGKV